MTALVALWTDALRSLRPPDPQRLIVICACLVLVPGTAHAGERSVAKEYTGPGVLTFGYCILTQLLIGEDSDLGGACFPLDGDEATVDITVSDDLSADVGGYHYFFGAPGGNAFFCGSAQDVPVPAGATDLVVALDAPFGGAYLCQSVATTGSITATFQLTP